MDAIAENPRAVVGGNMPPPEPFDLVKAKIDDLYMEAKNWLDGAVVDSPELAEGIATLLNNLRDAAKEADELRLKEKAPLDERIAAIQEKFAPLIADTKSKKGVAVLAIEACKKALATYQAKIKREQEARAAEARRIAEEARQAAEDAAYEAQKSADLEAAQKAAEAQEHARRTDVAAQAAANATPKVKNRGGRAIGLRTYYTAEVTNTHEAARFFWGRFESEWAEFIRTLAQKAVDQGERGIPGVIVKEEQRSA